MQKDVLTLQHSLKCPLQVRSQGVCAEPHLRLACTHFHSQCSWLRPWSRLSPWQSSLSCLKSEVARPPCYLFLLPRHFWSLVDITWGDTTCDKSWSLGGPLVPEQEVTAYVCLHLILLQESRANFSALLQRVSIFIVSGMHPVWVILIECPIVTISLHWILNINMKNQKRQPDCEKSPKFIFAILLNPFLIKIIHHLSITSNTGCLSICESILKIGINLK